MNAGFYPFEIINIPEERRTEYWFITNSGVVYYAYIIGAPEYLDEFESFEYLNKYGYVFGFSPQEDFEKDDKQYHDPLIRPTICHIILDFMRRFEKVVLIYHCDAADGKQRQRNIAFSQWFNAHQGIQPIHKNKLQLEVQLIDGTIRKEYLGYFASCSDTEIEMADREFKQFAREKITAGKQIA